MELAHAGSRRSEEGRIDLVVVDTVAIDRMMVDVGHTEVVVAGSLAAVVRSLGRRELERRSLGRMGRARRTAGFRIDRRDSTL